MKIDIFYPHLPPALDAIGESTVHLARHLAATHDVRLLCANSIDTDVVEGVVLVDALNGRLPRGVNGLPEAVRQAMPDWLLIPFNQFSYGRRGVNPWLPKAVSRIRRTCRETRIALLAHEGYAPGGTLRQSTLSLIQRTQLRTLGRLCDLVLLATHQWVQDFGPWFPQSTVAFLPIGSNLPACVEDRRAIRRRLGIADSALALVTFGVLGGGRDLDALASVAAETVRMRPDAVLIHVGAREVDDADRSADLSCRRLYLGRLAAPEAAAALHAADIAVAALRGGVSMRRGSFLAGLQQGTATITSSGPLTDPPLLEAAAAGAFVMVPEQDRDGWRDGTRRLISDPTARARMGSLGREYYQIQHDWPVVATQIEEWLRTCTEVGPR